MFYGRPTDAGVEPQVRRSSDFRIGTFDLEPVLTASDSSVAPRHEAALLDSPVAGQCPSIYS